EINIIEVESLKAGGFDVYLVASRSEFVEAGFTSLIGRAKRLRLSIPDQLHLRLTYQRAGRIFNDHFQARAALRQAGNCKYEKCDKHTNRPRMERVDFHLLMSLCAFFWQLQCFSKRSALN